MEIFSATHNQKKGPHADASTRAKPYATWLLDTSLPALTSILPTAALISMLGAVLTAGDTALSRGLCDPTVSSTYYALTPRSEVDQ